MELSLKINNKEKLIRIERDGAKYHAVIDDTELTAEWVRIGDNRYILNIGDEHFPVYLAGNGSTRYLHINGENHQVEIATRTRKQGAHGVDATMGEDENSIVAPMPGKIVKILVQKDDTISKGDNTVILEAMKMETHVTAPRDGSIAKIHVGVGDNVNLGETLIDLA